MTGLIDVGGGMRGAYTAGIYDYLLENNIEIDCCIGISAGSANMISYLSKQKGRSLKFYSDYAMRREYMSAYNFLKSGSYIDLDYIYSYLSNENGENPVDYDAFEESKSELEVVATHAKTGKAWFFNRKDISRDNFDVIKASCAVPIACKPYEISGEFFYDGGIADPIPYTRLVEKGCSKMILLLTRPKQIRLSASGASARAIRTLMRRYPMTAQAMLNRYEKYNSSIDEFAGLECEGRALIVSPEDIYGMKMLKKDRDTIFKLYKEGYEDAEKIADFLG
jgi:phospholipase, patatin family